MEGVTRRKFLQFTKGVAIGLVSTGPIASIFLKTTPLTVQTKEGNFHLRLYGHGVPGFPFNPSKEKDIPPQTEAIFLEGFPLEKEIFEGVAQKEKPTNNNETSNNSRSPNYADGAIDYAFKHECPLYFGDPAGTRLTNEFSKFGVWAIPAAELGLIMTGERIAEKLSSTASRREICNLAAWGLIAVGPGSYLSSTLLTPFLTQPGFKPIREITNKTEEVYRFVDWSIVFRNSQISYKLLRIAKKLGEREGRTPEITAVLGQHVGVEYWLEQGEEKCLRVMREFPKPILEGLLGLPIEKCAERISTTMKIRLKEFVNGKFSIDINLDRDPEIFKAIAGEREITERREIDLKSQVAKEVNAGGRGKERI